MKLATWFTRLHRNMWYINPVTKIKQMFIGFDKNGYPVFQKETGRILVYPHLPYEPLAPTKHD